MRHAAPAILAKKASHMGPRQPQWLYVMFCLQLVSN